MRTQKKSSTFKMVSKSGRMIFDLKPEGIPGIKVTFELDNSFFTHMSSKVKQKTRSFNSRKRNCRKKSKKGT